MPALSLREKVCRLAGDVDDAEWADFAQHWTSVEVAAGAHLTQQGQVEDYFYYVEQGVQRAYFLHEGNEVCVGFTYPPDFTGSYDSFVERSPATFLVQALTDSRLLRIHHDALQPYLQRYIWTERLFRVFHQQLFLAKAKHEVAVFTFSAEERYRRLWAAAPHLFQWVPQKHLASYLGMSAETFSRLRSRIK